MADDMLNQMKKQMPKLTRGGGVGIGMLGLAGAAGYCAYQSLFTGINFDDLRLSKIFCLFSVEAGHRAIMFNRIGGVGNEIYKEGLHLRIPWFQYPIIYDIRARPNQIRSPTGSKGIHIYVH